MASETAHPASSTRAPDRKSVLFCPDCWHESPIDGDWRVQAGTDTDVIGCPVCGATVTTRPVEETRHTPPTPFTPTCGSLLVHSVGPSLAWMVWPCTSPDAHLLLGAVGRDAFRSFRPRVSRQHCHL